MVKLPYLRIVNITKTFGNLIAVDNFSLDIEEGELICLLGPSGCGKTTLLRIVAGLEQPNTGQIIQAGKEIVHLPPRQRDFGIVFQSYALFPNLTARQNIAFGLENRKMPAEKVKARVNEMLELVGLTEAADKYPSQLSGGQQQRVAFARALATSPGLLLLDEPLSALDARVRVNLRSEIKRLQKRVGVTTIFVTHDQEEALVLADRIVVMRQGRIEQIGAPEEIYKQPATPFVADFVGVMNFLPAIATENQNKVVCGQLVLECANPHNAQAGEEVAVALRPEDIRLGPFSEALPNVTSATVIEDQFLGSFHRFKLSLKDMAEPLLVSEVSTNLVRDLNLQVESKVDVYLPPEFLKVYPKLGSQK